MNIGAFAKLGELFFKLLAALGIYRAGRKSAEAAENKETLEKIEAINEARADNRALTDEQLRDKLRNGGRR